MLPNIDHRGFFNRNSEYVLPHFTLCVVDFKFCFDYVFLCLDSDSSGSSSDDETASHTERSDRSDADKKVQ
jgi:hypothetical protein